MSIDGIPLKVTMIWLDLLNVICSTNLCDAKFVRDKCLILLHCYCWHTVCPTSATISGVTNGSTVYADTVISCAANNDVYPAATYTWINHYDNSTSIGSQFTLQPDKQYKLTCTASNNMDRCYPLPSAYVEVNSKLLLRSICTAYYNFELGL